MVDISQHFFVDINQIESDEYIELTCNLSIRK